jgi:hypothetical protein
MKNGTDDLFAFAASQKHSGPHSGRTAPKTSRVAAEKITPSVPSIRLQVLNFALKRGAQGFTDEQLIDALCPDDRKRAERSVRPRRTELANERWLLNTNEEAIEDGNKCVIWIHRDFHPNPPPTRDQGRPDTKLERLRDQLRENGITPCC